MPKSTKVEKIDGRTIKTKAPTKFRIGSRKANVNGHSMSTAALQTVLETADKSRFHGKAKTILQSRGVTL